MKYWLSICIFTVLVGELLFAGGHYGKMGQKHHHYLSTSQLEKELDLSEEQAQKIEKLKKTFKIKKLDYKKLLTPISIDIQKEMLSDKPDYVKIKSLLKQQSSISIDLKLDHLKSNDKIKSHLSEKQKRRYQHIMKRRHGSKEMSSKRKKRSWFKRNKAKDK